MKEREWPTFWRDQIVLVEWVDSFHSNGWESQESKLSEDHLTGQCQSVGWVMEDSDEWLGITPGLSGIISIDGLMRIPKVAVKSIKTIYGQAAAHVRE